MCCECLLRDYVSIFFFLMIRRPPRSTLDRLSAASDVYKRQVSYVLGRPLTHEETLRLEKSLAERLGYHFRIRWAKVDAIARGAGGKYEDFVSKLFSNGE